MRLARHALVITALLWPAAAAAQQGSIDFDRDVKPILREKCLACHSGPQAQAGLRLDARKSALLGSGSGVVIIPGTGSRSRLVWRISGSQYGPQMPPTGALKTEQIDTIRKWIDEGAQWPETETPVRAADARVVRLADAYRSGDRAAIGREAVDRAAVNLPGAGGTTPLMYAVLYGTLDDMRGLVDKGADVNARNDAGITPLILAATDTAKLTWLLGKGADPNRRSEDGRTALHVAAQSGATDAVKLLLAAHASANFSNGDSPLALAAAVGDPELIEALLAAGAPVTRQAGASALINAAMIECEPCLDMLAREAEPVALGLGLDTAADMSSLATMTRLLDKGAPIEAKDLFGGGTPLMLAAISDTDALAKVRLLLQRGADVTARSELGETALDYAKRRNDPAIVDALARAAAEHASRDLRTSIEQSIALLQKSDSQFVKNTGCMSCHHQVLPQMLVSMAQKKNLKLDGDLASRQFQAGVAYLDDRQPRALQGMEIAGGSDTVSYLLVGLDAHDYAPTPTTDAWARYLRMMQLADGHWRIQIHRPPIESSDIEVTAMSLRAMARYAPQAERAAYAERVRLAGEWLAHATPHTNEDRTFRLLGLKWAKAPAAAIAEAARDLRAAQRADGGWSQIATLDSDAYATGQALVALEEAGGVSAADPIYQRGVAFLLKTQHDDGSWLVRTRTVALQPQFDSGFPGGRDQWISAAGTAWAAMALTISIH